MNYKVHIIVCLFIAALSCRAQSSKVNERGLWDVWCAGTNSAFTAAEVVDACRDFTAKSPKDPLAVVVSGFAAWNYLKRGNRAAAVKLFDSMLVDGRATVLERAGDEMARSWLSRLDREKIQAALKKVYLRNIEFPESLDAVKTVETGDVPPLTDRWGKPWVYKRGSSIKGMETQRYSLESSELGVYSDLKKALELPYGDRIDLEPLRMVQNSSSSVEFKSSTGRTVVRKLGDRASRVYLVYVGAYIMVMTDGNHWSVMPKPR